MTDHFFLCLLAAIRYNTHLDKILTTLNELIDEKQDSSRSCALRYG